MEQKSQFIRLPKVLKTKSDKKNLNLTVLLSGYFGIVINITKNIAKGKHFCFLVLNDTLQ